MTIYQFHVRRWSACHSDLIVMDVCMIIPGMCCAAHIMPWPTSGTRERESGEKLVFPWPGVSPRHTQPALTLGLWLCQAAIRIAPILWLYYQGIYLYIKWERGEAVSVRGVDCRPGRWSPPTTARDRMVRPDSLTNQKPDVTTGVTENQAHTPFSFHVLN